MSKKIFIDCGGHDGCSVIKFLLEESPQAECISFEPNPIFSSYYRFLPTKLVQAAVGTFDGTGTLIIDPLDGDGSTLIPEKIVDKKNFFRNADCPKLTVSIVDLSQIIYQASKKYESIVLKLDIEGSEYDILEKLIKDKTISLLEKIYCEFHWEKLNLPQKRHEELIEKIRKNVDLEHWDARKYAVHKRSKKHMWERTKFCGILFLLRIWFRIFPNKIF